LRHAAIGDGRGANHVVLPRGHVARPVELRKGFGLARTSPRALPRHLGIDLEADETIFDLGDEARLAELAVVDDVDAQLDLLVHDLGDRPAQPRGVRLLVHALALLLGLDHVEQIGGTRQAADMGGENSLGASLHCASPLPPPSPRKRETSSPRCIARGYITSPTPMSPSAGGRSLKFAFLPLPTPPPP